MAVIGINYKEGTSGGYTGVYLRTDTDGDKEYNSGDPMKDWYDAMKEVLAGDSCIHLAMSSSVDHFIMDGAAFKSIYLNPKTMELSDQYSEEGIEFFIADDKELPESWGVFRAMCGDPKKEKA